MSHAVLAFYHATQELGVVIGTGVKAGQFFGQFPSQYGATLAQWFGVGAGSVSTIFPNIGNFPTSKLGILG